VILLLRPREYRGHFLPYGGLRGCSNVTCNTVIITIAYRFIEKFDKWPDSSRVGFAPPTTGRYSYGPLSVTASIIIWPDTGDLVFFKFWKKRSEL
jgi:hypothetical protein